MRRLLGLVVAVVTLAGCQYAFTPEFAQQGCQYEMFNPPGEAWGNHYLRIVDADVRHDGGAWQDLGLNGTVYAPDGSGAVFIGSTGTWDFDLDIEWADSRNGDGHNAKHYDITRTC